MIQSRRAPFVIFCSLVLVEFSAAQSTWYVDGSAGAGGDGSLGAPYDRVQGAIASGSTLSGDTVLVLPGTYPESVDYLGKDLDVRSTAGAGATILSGTGGSVVYVGSGESAARLEGFTLRNGVGTLQASEVLGGGILVDGAAAEIMACILHTNDADQGGGIWAGNGAVLTVIDTMIRNNSADYGGGIYVDDCSSVIDNCDIRLNTSRSGTGSGMLAGPLGDLIVTDSRIEKNAGGGLFVGGTPHGGGVRTSTPYALFQNCEISENDLGVGVFEYGNTGAGVSCDGAFSRFVGCTFDDNRSDDGLGGGFYGTGTLEDCVFSKNFAHRGGGAYASSSLRVIDCSFVLNGARSVTECSGNGGGLYGGECTTSIFTNNNAEVSGGGAYGASLSRCTFRSNLANSYCLVDNRGGGGIANCTAVECLLEDNLAEAYSDSFQTESVGGGARSSTLLRCTLRGNTVKSAVITVGPDYGHACLGGGAFDSQLTDCRIEGNYITAIQAKGTKGAGIYGGSALNCVFVNNTVTVLPESTGPALGGAAAQAQLVGCVLIGNTADHGAGVWGGSITNCTLAGNEARLDGGGISAAPPVPGGSPTNVVVNGSVLWGNVPDEAASNGGSIQAQYSNVQGGIVGMGNLSMDPLFWALPVEDVKLRPNSPCIDAGDPSLPLDPDGSVSDMGAYPFDSSHVAAPFPYCAAKLNSSGCLPSIRYGGTPSMGDADDFVILADNMIHQSATVAFWSRDSASVPFAGGLLCLAPTIHRTLVANSGGSSACEGVGSFHFSQSYLASHGLTAGDRVFAQFWQRDTAHGDGTGVGLSDGLDFTLIP